MLLEVKIKNFRSFKDEQIISMIAMEGYETSPKFVEQIQDNVFGHNSVICSINDINNDETIDNVEVRKSAVIYGANASGKSNIVLALCTVGAICAGINNFWNSSTAFFHNDQPSQINFKLLKHGHIYEYIIAWNKDRIVSEQLLHADKKIIFSRNYTDGQYQCSHLTSEELKHYFQFTSMQIENYKVNLKNTKGIVDRLELEKYIEDYIIGDFTKITSNIGDKTLLLLEFATSGYELMCDILIFLKDKIFIRTPTLSQDNLNLYNYDLSAAITMFGDDEKQVFNATENQDNYSFKFGTYDDMFNKFGADIQGLSYEINLSNPQQVRPYSYKRYHNKLYRFELMAEESAGTIGFLKYYALFHSLEKHGGGVLVIDEIDAHFHPLMVIEFLRYVNQKNSKNVVQVIATIHNTALLNREVLKDDQIYLLEKQDQASKLVSLAEYDLSEDQKNDLEKTYLSGVLGAIPDLRAIDIAIADDKNNL